jgi:TonB family protein
MKMMNRRWAALLAVLAAAAAATSPARAQAAGEPRAGAGTAAADTAFAYELSAVDEQPELLNAADVARLTEHNYPREMKRRRETGTVAMRILVRRDGVVDSAHVSVEYESQPGFADAAVRVARAMRFKPARVDGQPVSVWVLIPVQFWPAPRPAPPVWTPGSRP